MLEIKSTPIGSDLASELLDHFRSQWSDISEFTESHLGLTLPPPMVALFNSQLVGGLSYTSFQAPDTKAIALWINAVLIVPNYRKSGIATALIENAIKTLPCVYALTDIPHLYEKMGFVSLHTDIQGTIVKFENT